MDSKKITPPPFLVTMEVEVLPFDLSTSLYLSATRKNINSATTKIAAMII